MHGERLIGGGGQLYPIPPGVQITGGISIRNTYLLLTETDLLFGPPRLNHLLAYFNLSISSIMVLTMTFIYFGKMLPSLTYYWFLCVDGPRTLWNACLRLGYNKTPHTLVSVREFIKFNLLASNVLCIFLVLLAFPLSLAQMFTAAHIADKAVEEAAGNTQMDIADAYEQQVNWSVLAFVLTIQIVGLISHIIASVPALVSLLRMMEDAAFRGNAREQQPLFAAQPQHHPQQHPDHVAGDVEMGAMGGAADGWNQRNANAMHFQNTSFSQEDEELKRALNLSMGLPADHHRMSTSNPEAILDRSLRESQDYEYEQAILTDQMAMIDEKNRAVEAQNAAEAVNIEDLVDEGAKDRALKTVEARRNRWTQSLVEPNDSDMKNNKLFCKVRIRLPSGEQVERKVFVRNKMAALFALVDGAVYEDAYLQVSPDLGPNGHDGAAAQHVVKYGLASSYPRKLYFDPNVTIESCGLQGKHSLVVEILS